MSRLPPFRRALARTARFMVITMFIYDFKVLKACVRVTSESWSFHCDLLCINKLGRFMVAMFI